MRPNSDKSVFIFGGCFDPPHLGHLAITELLQQRARAVHVMVAAQPPHRRVYASAPDRFRMAQMQWGERGVRGLCVDDRELKRSGPSYSADTIREMTQEYGFKPIFTLGSDQLEALPQWHGFPDILGLCHWLVFARRMPEGTVSGADPRRVLAGWTQEGLLRAGDAQWNYPAGVAGLTSLSIIEHNVSSQSSTQIRAELGGWASCRGPLPTQLTPAVLAYLLEQGLYGTHLRPRPALG